MFNYYRISCVLAKQSFHNQTSKLFLNIAETNFRRNYKLSSSIASVCTQCRYADSALPLNQNKFSLYPNKQNFISSQNFSTSSTLWSWMQSNQDKEKIKNYVFIGAVIFSVIFVFYMYQTMEFHQDYVHIEPSEKKK